MDKFLTKNQIQQLITDAPQSISSEQIINGLISRGYQLEGLEQSKPKTETTNIATKIASFTGGEELGKGLGQALAMPGNVKRLEQVQQQGFDIQGNLIRMIRDFKSQGKDTSRLEGALNDITNQITKTGAQTGQMLNPEQLTPKQVIGDALQLGTTIVGAGSLSGVGTQAQAGYQAAKTGKNVLGAVRGAEGVLKTGQFGKAIPSAVSGITEATSIGQGLLQGAETGAISGAAFGGATGVSQGLQKDKDLSGILQEGTLGAVGGGITGGILGGLIGGVSGGLRGRALRQEVLNEQVKTGQKTLQTAEKLSVQKAKAIEIAKEQGFEQPEIDFLGSMKSPDKKIALRMTDLAQQASRDKRIIERPIDIVGENMVQRIKFIDQTNKKAGQAVNEVAKQLRGQAVDANPIMQQAQSLVDDLGIQKLPTGKLDFSNSVFKNTPAIQKKLQKFIQEIPTGQADAYDVHIFKKSIDELVEYGTQGEGLKGNAERILKALRTSADDVLDNTFEAYNKANTDFRATKMVLDEVDDLFGKVGVGKERGGQLLRSVFSNNAQRPRVLKLVEALDNTSKAYGKKFKDNLVDQALFTEILEDIYGTQATTSLQGQVQRAVSGGKAVIEGIKDPLKGAGQVVGVVAEKIAGISDENKKKILSSLLRN